MQDAAKEPDYFAGGSGFEGLCANLMRRAPAIFGREFEPGRLRAIEQQAGNIRDEATYGIEVLGKLLAAAGQSTEGIEPCDISHAGYLIQFLSRLAQSCVLIESNARNTFEHGPLV